MKTNQNWIMRNGVSLRSVGISSSCWSRSWCQEPACARSTIPISLFLHLPISLREIEWVAENVQRCFAEACTPSFPLYHRGQHYKKWSLLILSHSLLYCLSPRYTLRLPLKCARLGRNKERHLSAIWLDEAFKGFHGMPTSFPGE